MPKKKEQYPPLSREERVGITKDAIKQAAREFMEARKEEAVNGAWGFMKRLFWWFVGLSIAGFLHVLFHGKYHLLTDAIANAVGQ